MIYLDNASTTQFKPQCVVDAVVNCLAHYSVNPNRNVSEQSVALQQKILTARNKLHLLYNNDSARHVVFAGGCTAALNTAILGRAQRGHVVITACEHNAVIRPIMQLKRKGYVEVSVAAPNQEGQITAEEIAKHLRHNTYMVCVNHASNVTGTCQKQIAQIGALCKQRNITLLVDCAQTAGYVPLNMTKCNVNMVALPAHKGLHAMQGVGALIFDKKSVPRPILFGGTGTESHLLHQPTTLPENLESGTLPCPAILAMDAGVDHWLSHWQQHRNTVRQMQQLLLDGIGQIDGITLFSQANDSGIVAFNLRNVDSGEIADALWTEHQIAVRGGLHCAPLMHKWLGTTEQGVVRASVATDTTKEQCYTLISALRNLAKKFM